MKNEKLKSCPFCGNDQVILVQRDTRHGVIVFAQCITCGAQGKASYNRRNPGADDFWEDESCRFAVMRWNERASDGRHE